MHEEQRPIWVRVINEWERYSVMHQFEPPPQGEGIHFVEDIQISPPDGTIEAQFVIAMTEKDERIVGRSQVCYGPDAVDNEIERIIDEGLMPAVVTISF